MASAIPRFSAILWLVCCVFATNANAEQFRVVTAAPEKMTRGTTAFVDTRGSPRIVEIDAGGKVVWQCPLRSPPFKPEGVPHATDLEWIAADDTFLVAIPFNGIFRIDRKCKVVWKYLTSKVSHDADLLPNGNVLHTFGWDKDSDPTAVEVDAGGKVVWSWRARDHVDPAERRGAESRREHRPSFAHSNAVVRLPDGDTLVSLRNFNRVARVAPDGSVRRFYGPIRLVHEPNLLPDGTLLAASRNPMHVIALEPGGGRRVVFANGIDIKPIRTVQLLDRGNMLLTGGEDIVEIDGAGAVVWHVEIYRGLGDRITSGVYKAVRVAK